MKQLNEEFDFNTINDESGIDITNVIFNHVFNNTFKLLQDNKNIIKDNYNIRSNNINIELNNDIIEILTDKSQYPILTIVNKSKNSELIFLIRVSFYRGFECTRNSFYQNAATDILNVVFKISFLIKHCISQNIKILYELQEPSYNITYNIFFKFPTSYNDGKIGYDYILNDAIIKNLPELVPFSGNSQQQTKIKLLDVCFGNKSNIVAFLNNLYKNYTNKNLLTIEQKGCLLSTENYWGITRNPGTTARFIRSTIKRIQTGKPVNIIEESFDFNSVDNVTLGDSINSIILEKIVKQNRASLIENFYKKWKYSTYDSLFAEIFKTIYHIDYDTMFIFKEFNLYKKIQINLYSDVISNYGEMIYDEDIIQYLKNDIFKKFKRTETIYDNEFISNKKENELITLQNKKLEHLYNSIITSFVNSGSFLYYADIPKSILNWMKEAAPGRWDFNIRNTIQRICLLSKDYGIIILIAQAQRGQYMYYTFNTIYTGAVDYYNYDESIKQDINKNVLKVTKIK